MLQLCTLLEKDINVPELLKSEKFVTENAIEKHVLQATTNEYEAI